MSSTLAREDNPTMLVGMNGTNALVPMADPVEAQVWWFGDVPIRTVIRNGLPWLVLPDLCKAIGLGNPSETANRLKPHERETLILTEGIRSLMPEVAPQVQSITIISESGFYRLVMRSSKPLAERFQTWAVEVVFPAIRKTGSYSPDPGAALLEALRDPNKVLTLIGDYATRLLAADARADQATLQRDEAARKAETLAAAHALFASHDGTFSVTVAAKTLNTPPKKLFAWLAANGWIYRPSGRGEYVAYQTRIQQGLMIMATHEIQKADGDIQEVSRVRMTTKGLDKVSIAMARPEKAV